RRGEAVNAVEHSAVAREEAPAVFQPALALEHALEQVADNRDEHGSGTQREESCCGQPEPGTPRERDQEPRDEPAQHALPGLVRTHDRRKPEATELPTREIRANVRCPCEQQHEYDEFAAAFVLVVETREREP